MFTLRCAQHHQALMDAGVCRFILQLLSRRKVEGSSRVAVRHQPRFVVATSQQAATSSCHSRVTVGRTGDTQPGTVIKRVMLDHGGALGGQAWHEAAPVVNSPCALQTQPHHSPASQQEFVRPASGGSLSAQPLSAPHRASAGSTQPRTKGAPCHPPPLCETHQRSQKIKKFLQASDYACVRWLFGLVLSFLGIFWGFCLLALFSYCIHLNVL